MVSRRTDWLTVTVLGRRGQGKSLLARHLVRDCQRLLVIDAASDRVWENQGLLISGKNSFSVLAACSKYLGNNDSGRFRLVLRPGRLSELPDFVEAVFDLARRVKNLTVVVEELSLCVPGVRLQENFLRAVVLGRHDSVRVLATAQRPAQVDKTLIAESVVYVGRVRESNDRRYLRGLGVSRESLETVRQLPAPGIDKRAKTAALVFFEVDRQKVRSFKVSLS